MAESFTREHSPFEENVRDGYWMSLFHLFGSIMVVTAIGILSLSIGCSPDSCPFRSCSSGQPEYDFGNIVDQLPELPETQEPYPFPPLEGHENCKVTGDRAYDF